MPMRWARSRRSLSPSGLVLSGVMAAMAPDAGAQQPTTTSLSAPTVSVTGARIGEPLSEVLRPSEYVAPSPDAAQLLRTVPGFSLSRVGGAASDPLLRGLNGSRIQIIADGAPVEGACSHRMDPPTTYLPIDTFDRITVTKGPSSVRHGAAIAGVVEFQRDAVRPEKASASLGVNAQAGSFDQHQAGADLRLATPGAALRAYGTRAASGDYADGNGNTVHSRYDRYNAGLSAAVFPTDDSRIEINADSGDGEAAYPTFHMDGTRFRRDRVGAKLQVARSSGAFARAELRGSWADTDHRMDDYSLRPPHVTTTPLPGGALTQTTLLAMTQTLASRSAAADSTWRIGPAELLLGADTARERYVGRNNTASTTCLQLFGVSNCAGALRDWSQYDVSFERTGLYAEVDWWTSDRTRLKGGWRLNRQETVAGDLYNFIGTTPLPGADSQRTQLTRSGFARAETGFGDAWSAFAAVGTAERPANALEVTSYAGFDLKPERTVQVDVGATWTGTDTRAGVDVFANRIDDFILIYQGTQSQNVDASMTGGEVWLSHAFGSRLRTSTSYTWVHGENRTDQRPLPQMPPHEWRVGAEWTADRFTFGVSGRLVARQDGVAIGYGNVTGVDLGPTAGFGVWSLRASWQFRDGARLSVGVDNLFDRAYAEHLNRTGAFAPAGFVPTFRINEPGRVLWVRLEARFQ